MDIYNKFLDLYKTNPRSDELASFMLKYNRELYDYLKTMKVYRYMITFTLNPKLVDPSNSQLQQVIEDYIIKQVCKHSSTAYIAKEHASTNCHWHVVLLRSKKFKYNEFNYYKRKYGNIDISLSKTESMEDGLEYISKESTPKQIK